MAENKGGYDVEFLHEQFDDMKCSICLLVLREPMQADECGHRFCKSCVVNIEKSGQKKYICPQDRTKMSLFRDKGREREILNRPVKCIHHKEGCCWANALRELEYHTKECDFEDMVCPFNDCGDKFQRRFLAKHNKEDCLYRTMLCPFCDEEYSFHLEQDHIEDCDYLPICCDYCQARDIPRYKMETHLIQKCAKAPRQCDFAHLGCEEQMLMYDIAKHNTNFSDHHINLALQKISVKENIIETMRQDKEVLKEQNSDQAKEIQRLKGELQRQYKEQSNITKSDYLKWEISAFTNEVAKATQWKMHNIQSKSFYTSLGYHIKVELYPNYQNSVGIFVQTITGKFDKDLKWPMDKALFHFHILNKDIRWIHRHTLETTVYQADIKGPLQKPPHTSHPLGSHKLLRHAEFPTFLKDDTLSLVISVVNVK